MVAEQDQPGLIRARGAAAGPETLRVRPSRKVPPGILGKLREALADAPVPTTPAALLPAPRPENSAAISLDTCGDIAYSLASARRIAGGGRKGTDMTSTIQIEGTIKTTSKGRTVIEAWVYGVPREILDMSEGDAPIEVECGGGTYTVTGRGTIFRAARWEGGKSRTRELVYLYVSGGTPSRQQAERNYDSVHNEGHGGYNPHRIGDRKTY